MSVVSTISTNLDGNDDDKLRGSQQTNQSSYNKMLYIGKELCFLLLIVFTTYASFNSNSNRGSGPPPTPLFPRDSIVSDFYKGELSEALQRASDSDVAFVMYYAPWDAECQMARRHFETVAQQHFREVHFAAINCWQPHSECKRTLNKIQHFPKLVAYKTHESGVEYRGPLDARYMSAFLDGVIRPLHRLTSSADLLRLRSAYNAVVVAHLNFQGTRGGPPYRAMYETALKFLERDTRQEVAFAVVTSFKTTLDMGGNRAPCIKLFLWNETLDYEGHYGTAPLTEWITSRLHQVSLWLSPPGVKSLTLAPYVTHGPALIMFTPLENFVTYNLLREIGLEFYNCNNNSAVIELSSQVAAYVSGRISQMRRVMLSCQSQAHLATTVQIADSVWSNSSCGKRKTSALLSGNGSQLHCFSKSDQCADISLLALARQRNKLTMVAEQDPLSSPALTDFARHKSCIRIVPPPTRPSSTPAPSALRGLACRYNRSVSLLALDSSLYGHFARGLGVEMETAKDQTKVVLVNSHMESTYVLNELLTRESLGMFLVNFTEGRLERHQRSLSPSAQSTPSPAPATPVTTVSAQELTTETFLPVAFNDSMNVVVFFYTPFCAFCHTVSHVYLSVVRQLHNLPSLLFTRIDGENNDLPWQFTAPQYPSVLFFPARRKAESRVFSSRVGITVNSLAQFVLANLPLDLRLTGMMQLCQTQLPGQRRECLVNVRREVLEAISTHLARYRSLSLHLPPSRLRRKALGKELTRLQHLKQLQLALSVDSQGRSLPLSSHWLSQLTQSASDTPPTISAHHRDEL